MYVTVCKSQHKINIINRRYILGLKYKLTKGTRYRGI